MRIETLKYFIQSANVNFFFGSGLSRPYLPVLKDIEKWLTEIYELRQKEEKKVAFDIVEASILKRYFETVIYPNVAPVGAEYDSTIAEYKRFLLIWNDIINKRSNRLIGKQVNLFTTNIDLFMERAAAGYGVELNDGFHGTLEQTYDEGNFQKTISKTSLHFQNVTDIPVFNLMKIHGSINWKEEDNHIKNDIGLKTVIAVKKSLDSIDDMSFISTTSINSSGEMVDKTMSEMISEADSMFWVNSGDFDDFFNEYRKLIMINPTKRKFKESVIDHHFYELMRQYSNNLEKETTLLIVSGFSFADEHIADITRRAANTNPTLHIIVFTFNDDAGKDIKANLNIPDVILNNNISIITPSAFKTQNEDSQEIKYRDFATGVIQFDFATVNSLFDLLSQGIVTYDK